jgi:uncharacterized protein (TIGR02453 family)
MLQPDTLLFLRELKAHNTKEWFDENRDRYQTAKANVLTLIDRLIEEIAGFDPDIRGLEAKQCLFRINRDIRFSKNKAPYKTNFGASIAKGGRRSPFAGYYLHLQPGEIFIGGGIYMPPSPTLKAIRAHIDHNAPDLRKMLADPDFQKVYGEIQGESLKTAPKGYEQDHPAIDLLRLKSFVVTRNYSDDAALSEVFYLQVVEDFEVMKPMLDFLNEAVENS